ncbi:MAG: site-specific integrase [Deltaproteobacteria bacterium]|jgi:integrase|nr:site-specific integrase [Deltaproteobacteria bacterium]
MAIREKIVEGKKTYEVSLCIRSKHRPGVRVQRLWRGYTNLRDAQAAEKKMVQECAMELAKKEGTTLNWDELLERYELQMRKGTACLRPMQANILRETISMLRNFTADWLKRDCRTITPGDVRQIFNRMEADGYSRGRIRAVKSGVNGVFRFGMEEGHLNGVTHSPAQNVMIQKSKEEKPPLILSLSEIQKLLEEARRAEHPWYPVWFMALNTGMRSGELYALTWTDIDWDNRLITVSKSYNNRMKKTKSTKAGYWRKVPMNVDLEAMLKDLRAKVPMDQEHVLPRLSRWDHGESAKFLRGFCQQIGITEVNFHALRACFATHLLNAGVSAPIVKKICGWTEEKVMNRYIRLAGLDVSGATESLSFTLPTDEETKKKVVNMRDVRLSKAETEPKP